MRGRSRNNNNGGGSNKGPNPLTRSYESNGPDVKDPRHCAACCREIQPACQGRAFERRSGGGGKLLPARGALHPHHRGRPGSAARAIRLPAAVLRGRGRRGGGFPGSRQANGDDGDPSSQPQPFDARGGDADRVPVRPERPERTGSRRSAAGSRRPSGSPRARSASRIPGRRPAPGPGSAGQGRAPGPGRPAGACSAPRVPARPPRPRHGRPGQERRPELGPKSGASGRSALPAVNSRARTSARIAASGRSGPRAGGPGRRTAPGRVTVANSAATGAATRPSRPT